MPAFGRLVSGIMPATEITSPSRPGMMPDHAGDPGTVCSVLAPHDHLHISHDILQRTICDLPLAIRALPIFEERYEQLRERAARVTRRRRLRFNLGVSPFFDQGGSATGPAARRAQP
jgi:hypothetical protein